MTYLKGINGSFSFNVHHRHSLSTTSIREALYEDIHSGVQHGVAALLQRRFIRMPVMYNVDTCSTVKGAGMMREDRFSMNIMQIVGHKFY